MSTFATIYKEAARNLSLLSSDESTVISSGRVTLTGIKNQANLIYQDKICNYLTARFPYDFEQSTYPMQTYRTNFVVSASSTGTTLISTTPIFNNSDEGFTIQFVTGSTFTGPTATASFASCKILQYVNSTTVVIDQTVSATWNATTGFILGNEFQFNGDAVNCKEIIALYYQSTPNTIYLPVTQRMKADLAPRWTTVFSQGNPAWYQTTNLVNGASVRAVGLLPFPTDYRGSIRMDYVRRPAALINDSDIPQLEIAGISDVLINGITAWGLRLLGMPKEASAYEEGEADGTRGPLGLKAMLKNYIPVNRNKSSKIRMSGTYSAMQGRSV